MRHVSIVSLIIVSFFAHGYGEEPSLKFGVMADCQYCAKATRGRRHYQESPQKLMAALAQFQKEKPAWLTHLGDFIDDKHESFAPLLKICDDSKFKIYHVLGNHDFSVQDDQKEGVPALLGMPARYYSWQSHGWRFIALDGNDISFHAYPKDSPRYLLSKEYYEKLISKTPKWNGAIGPEQFAWLRQQLDAAQTAQEPVVLLCHFPIFPKNSHNLWNADEVLAVIDDYPGVKAWFNGHNHAGNYAERNGVHYLTFQGMVDTAENSFATVSIRDGAFHVHGFGREKTRELVIRK